MEVIDKFSDSNFFLSNFYFVPVEYEGITFPSVEHAYQASKTTQVADRQFAACIKKPGEVKRWGKTVPLRHNFDAIKYQIMWELCYKKFTANQKMTKLLLSTGNAKLVEGNWWGDTYWGVCNDKGENNLGKILMDIREFLHTFQLRPEEIR